MEQKKILIVDDSRSIRKVIRDGLVATGMNYKIEDVSSGIEAIQRIEEISPDLITLDVNMPEKDGFETCLEIRSLDNHCCKIPIVFVTDQDTAEGRESGFKAGATDFVSKSAIRSELYPTIHNILFPTNMQFEDTTVLIVDPSQISRITTAILLERYGAKTIQVENGKEALNTLKKDKSKIISAILTDQEMPEVTGVELTKQMRTEMGLKSIPIIFLTKKADTALILSIFQSGATDYLAKPYLKEELLSRVGTHLNNAHLIINMEKYIGQLKTKNAEKDQILSICAHDLKTPLNVVIGFSELVNEEEDVSKQESYLESIHTSAKSMLEMIDSILQLSSYKESSKSLPLYQLNLTLVIEKSLRMCGSLISKKNLTLTANHKDFKECMVFGNEIALLRVFNNLISNAVKFSQEQKSIEIFMERINQEVCVRIKDFGIGIPEEDQKHIFIPFKHSQNGTRGEKGTGLGLSIVKEIIDSHGGKITLTSVVDQGTEFSLTLQTQML